MIFGESALKDAYRKVVWGPGRGLLEASPPAWELHAIRGVARSAAAVLGGKRAHLRRNLGRAFPESDEAALDPIARQAFTAHFSNQYASFSFGKCTLDTWRAYLCFAGRARLDAALALGRGVVLMHPHMGPAQLPLHVLGLLGYPMHQVGGGRVTLVELSETGRWAAETRGRLEARMPVTLHDGRGYIRPALRALQAGGVLMSACDATGGGEELGSREVRTVLGQPFGVPLGPVWLAWRSGAPLLSVHCHRNPSPGPAFVAEIGPEVRVRRDLPRRAAMAAGADEVATYLDRVLRSWPGDWLFWDGFEPGGLLASKPGEAP